MPPPDPAFIGVDWGTSSFRAYLADREGGALDAVDRPQGALSLAKGAHEAFLADCVAPWRERHGALPVVMSGMVGARSGWREAPYATTPCTLMDLAAASVTLSSPRVGPIRLIPGLSTFDASGAPDVMRGEETQVFGAMAALGISDGRFILPGTHSKWVHVAGGSILSFASFMTGEVFAALKGHSILGALMSGAGAQGEGFAQGLRAASRLRAPGDLLNAIFKTRTLGLFEKLPPDQLADYLSGLLIGAELLSGLGEAKGAIVVGAADLTRRYCEAGRRLGVALSPAPANCVLLGQAALLRHWRATATG